MKREDDKATTKRTSEWDLEDSEDEAHTKTECGHHGQEDEGVNKMSKKNCSNSQRRLCYYSTWTELESAPETKSETVQMENYNN